MVAAFEDAFRRAVDEDGPYGVAGEVWYWKNYGTYQSRDRVTRRLLTHLANTSGWTAFCSAVRDACARPTFDAFRQLQGACNQHSAFATPVTFVAFYQPESYPMADKHIANWRAQNRARMGFERGPAFSQRSDGWVEAMVASDTKARRTRLAYLAWAEFCRNYAQRIGDWRARDVEMAVWMAQKQRLELPPMA